MHIILKKSEYDKLRVNPLMIDLIEKIKGLPEEWKHNAEAGLEKLKEHLAKFENDFAKWDQAGVELEAPQL